jgi:hypothetical protein
MWSLLEKIPYSVVIPLAVVLFLAPFRPMPHALEKINMLIAGNLNRPMDIFDLFFHLFPTLILLLKLYGSSIKADR